MVHFLPLLTKDVFDNDLDFRAYMKLRRQQITNYEWRLTHKSSYVPRPRKKKEIKKINFIDKPTLIKWE